MQVKTSFFYSCDERLCKNTFIDWCKPINNIELTTVEGEGVNEINRIVDEVKKTKDELQ
jgi:hypothetical protein